MSGGDRTLLSLLCVANEARTLNELAELSTPILAERFRVPHAMYCRFDDESMASFGSISDMGRFGREEYQREFREKDPVLEADLAAPQRVVRSSQLIDYRKLKRTDLFDAVYRQNDVSTILFSKFDESPLAGGSFSLALMRGSKQRDFTAADEQRLRGYWPVLNTAWRRLHEADIAKERADQLEKLLSDADPRPRMLFDRAGNFVWASSSTRAIWGPRLPRHLSDVLPAYQKVIASPCPATSLALERPQGGLVRAVLHRNPSLLDGTSVLVLDDFGAPSPRLLALAKCAGLTRRETQVLASLAVGLGTHRIASALFISRHTVRTHVKNVLAKVGVHSREELDDMVAGRGPGG